MQTAGGVEDDGIEAVFDGVLHGLLRGADGVLRAALEHGQSGLLTHDLKLLDGGGAVDVAGGQKDVLAAFFEHLAQLRAVRRFARALQTAHQDDRRRLGGDLQPTVGAAHQGDQLLVDNLDDLLRGHEALEHLAAHRALRDLGHEVLDDLEVDVRLQQRELDLAHAGLDVGLGQLAFVPKFRESLRHFVDQALKHIRTLPFTTRGFSPPPRGRPHPCFVPEYSARRAYIPPRARQSRARAPKTRAAPARAAKRRGRPAV